MYTLNYWGSHLGIVAVNLSHQEYPRARNPRGIRPESALPTRISGRNPPGIRDESARIPPGICPIIFNGFIIAILPLTSIYKPSLRLTSFLLDEVIASTKKRNIVINIYKCIGECNTYLSIFPYYSKKS